MAVKKKVNKNIKEIKNKEKISLKIPDLQKLFFKPKQFLSSVEKENKIWPILSFFVLFYLAYYVLSLILRIVNKGEMSYLQYIAEGITGFIGVVIIAFIAPFICAGIIHLGVLIFGGREKFFNTFKPAIYSLIIGIIYSVISLILIFLLQFVIPINPELIAKMQDSSNFQNPQIAVDLFKQYFSEPLVIISIIISIISMIHQLVFLVMGISKFQKMSKIKSFLAAIIIPLIIFIILALGILWVIIN